MDAKDRELFWNTLCSLQDNSEDSINALSDVIKPPKWLCRFRGVSESTLLSLQKNIMSFSSAAYYDDPFDTYFYLDRQEIANAWKQLSRILSTDNGEWMHSFIRSLPIPEEEKGIVLNQYEQICQVSQNLQLPNNKLSEIYGIRERVARTLYSICFCDDPRNETLWLKYADNHRGFVQMYDTAAQDVLQCGQLERCGECMFKERRPSLYPVYYSSERHNATRYALSMLALETIPSNVLRSLPTLENAILSPICWEAERISLNKKKCHENDAEWRMICPLRPLDRPSIGMKPTAIALGLRMPEYKRRLVVSAAAVAGIESIYEMYIDESDNLNMRLINRDDTLGMLLN